jgi:hypothetical protein
MAGHLNSFGAAAPVPKKRLERMLKASRRPLACPARLPACLPAALHPSACLQTPNPAPRCLAYKPRPVVLCPALECACVTCLQGLGSECSSCG